MYNVHCASLELTNIILILPRPVNAHFLSRNMATPHFSESARVCVRWGVGVVYEIRILDEAGLRDIKAYANILPSK